MIKKIIIFFVGALILMSIYEIFSYNYHIDTSEVIKAQFKNGIPHETIQSFLEENQKELQIRSFRVFNENNKVWCVIHLDTPFSILALCNHKGFLVSDIDDDGKFRTCIWAM